MKSQAQAWLAAIVDSSDDAIVGKRLDGTIVSWNEGAHRVFGYSASEIVGRSVLLLFPPELKHEEDRIVGLLTKGERVRHFETTRVRKDGVRIEVSLSVSPILDPAGSIIGAAKIARDITDDKRMREQLRLYSDQLQSQAVELEQQLEDTSALSAELEEKNLELAQALASAREALAAAERARADADHARAEADRANRAKSEFLAMMSHELRTPLNAISGYADLMDTGVAGDLPPTYRSYIERIRKSQQHLLDLISRVLDLSKLEAGRLQIELEPVSVRRVLDRIEDMVAPLAAAKRQRLEQARPVDSVQVLANEERAVQILLNLVANAIKFTPTDGRISVSADAVDSRVLIRVRDTGAGVPSADADRIFEPFVQGAHTLSRRQPGAGLGLAISRELARAMGGEVKLEHTDGSGSTFTLQLKRA